MTMTLNLPPELDRQVRSEAARTSVAVDEVEISAAADQYQGRTLTDAATALPAEQAHLLTKINAGLPTEFWERYHALRARRQDPNFPDADREALLDMVDRIEALRVHRLERLIELAKLQDVSVQALSAQLQIPPLVPPHESHGEVDE